MQIEVLESSWDACRLLDSGNRRKLEQFGSVRIVRSEPKAWWRPALPAAEWAKAVATHEDDAREGRWRLTGDAPREWEVALPLAGTAAGGASAAKKLRLQLRFTDNSKQVGVFPEQSPHWATLAATAGAGGRLLNLFGYTGTASLAAAAAGWRVTHVDASKPAIAWGRRNQELSRLGDAPIRWLVEDAPTFVRREARRGNRYDALILDPPAFGRGPTGELWKIERDLPPLLDACREILSERPRLILLTVYTIDASSLLCRNLLEQLTAGFSGTGTGTGTAGGALAFGELALRDLAGRLLSLSLWGRWTAA
ncbi:MAG: class I SAM-dependent methyltransferase [Puniceicoccales bacterium]|jgi:23S rRNA (cytosine1962-C5)-methyltransferase|nr:class I SAM-dependent methyltransferase [Puniceicoccales bacterium]